MKRILYLLILGCSLTIFLQNEQKFDSIFSQWKDKNVPGVAGGAIHNGMIIYLKGFGNADVQNNIKITPQTKFQVDDFAKQLTVFKKKTTVIFLKIQETERLSFIQ